MQFGLTFLICVFVLRCIQVCSLKRFFELYACKFANFSNLSLIFKLIKFSNMCINHLLNNINVCTYKNKHGLYFMQFCFQRSSQWRNEIELFSSGEKVCPLNAKVNVNESLHGKTNNFHRQKQKHRSA